MPHVHFLGHVRTGIVHNDRPARIGHRNAKSIITGHRRELALEKPGIQPQVDEARTGNFHLPANPGHIEMINDVLCHFPWFLFQTFSKRQGDVGLVVTETRIRRGRDLRTDIGRLDTNNGSNRCVDANVENGFDGFDGSGPNAGSARTSDLGFSISSYPTRDIGGTAPPGFQCSV